MNKHRSVTRKTFFAKLPQSHKCYGCVWAQVLEQRVLCVRMPCVRKRQVK